MIIRSSLPNPQAWFEPGYSCVISALLTLSLIAAAQIQNGQFTGLVADPTGAVIPQANITVTNLETGLTVTVMTNESGSYTARELPVGMYRIAAEARGFGTAIKTDLTLNAGTIQRLDFNLVIGSTAEKVEVTGGATAANTETAKLSETVGANQISNLPLNGRNVYDLTRRTGQAPNATAQEQVLLFIRNMIAGEAAPLSAVERDRLSREILDEIFRLGPLEPLLKDPGISDIFVNRFVEFRTRGRLRCNEDGPDRAVFFSLATRHVLESAFPSHNAVLGLCGCNLWCSGSAATLRECRGLDSQMNGIPFGHWSFALM